VYGSTYLSSITLLVNSYGTSIHLQALDSSGVAINLTGNTSLTFQASQLGSSTNQLSSTSVVVDNAASGLCHYVPVANDFDDAGTYYAQLTIAYASSTIVVGDLIIVVTSGSSQPQTAYCSKTDVESLLQETTEYNDTTAPTSAQVNDWIIRQTQNLNKVVGSDFLPHNNVVEYYDALGYGPRAGKIVIKGRPILSLTLVEYWANQKWNTATQGYPDDPANAGLQTYWYYSDAGEIDFNALRLNMRQAYRITYSYGYSNIPNEIRDLCTRMAALDVLLYKANGTISSFNVATLRIVYSGGWELGRQEQMLLTSINRDLRALKRHFIDTG
jgi:hypothetical protein